MEFKGTKGKWHSCCKTDTPHYTFAKEGEITICGFYQKQEMGDDLPIEEVRANATLIQYAPELLEMLITAKDTIQSLKLSMLAHPDCQEGSEFDDYTSTAQEVEDEITELITKATT